MSNVYRCPHCQSTAIQLMWDETTEAFYQTKYHYNYHYVHIEDAEYDFRFKCPYCGKWCYLEQMVKVSKVKIKRTGHLDEDLFEI